MEYRREIDGLRAVAVLPVILFHAGFQFFGGGFVGVDVFFVISGYLITTILIHELEAGQFSILNFYERRARRILPALFLLLFACLPFAWLWLVPDDLKGFAQSLVAVTAFASNILFWEQSDYFDSSAEFKPLLHTWSLAVEEQFYLLFPLFLMLFWRRDQRLLLAVLVGTALASLGAAQWGVARDPSATFFLLPTRAWELAIGALCAYYMSRPGASRHSQRTRELASLAGLGLIGTGIFAFSKYTPFPSVYALLPTVGAALIILFAVPSTTVGKILGSRLMVGVGLVSYSAYLWHQPILAFARHRSLDGPSPALMAALVVLTLVLAYLSWQFVEKPFRNRSRFGRQQIFAFAIAGSLLFFGIGMAGHKTNGMRSVKTTPQQEEVLRTVTASPERAACHTKGLEYRKPQDACAFNGPAGEWAVFGDSHAIELAHALAVQLNGRHQGVRQFSFSGCSPSYQRADTNPGCSDWTREAVDFIAADPHIKEVVVSYRIHSALFGDHEGIYPRLPDEFSDAKRDAIWASYKTILNHFASAGKHVTVVLQAPELPRQVDKLIRQADDPRTVDGVTTDWWRRRSAFVEQRLGELPAGVRILRPETLFCDAARCYAVKDGKALYFDDDHMSSYGAGLVAQQVVAAQARACQNGCSLESTAWTSTPSKSH
ncbi:acyltransferase family protein [Pseudoduganella sp. R-43]|uniref:acyltransferase family protein n=1 Tax=Pseudoduganella sp. R-43 TaxID=3404063 RepID=UPI003CE78D30